MFSARNSDKISGNRQSSVICIKPIGGLGNRLRTIDAAIALAQANHSYLEVIWQLNADLNCRFEDLFELPSSIDRIVQIDTSDLFSRLVEKICRTKIGGMIQSLYFKYVLKSFDLVLTFDRMESYHARDYIGCDFQQLAADKRVYIATVHRFYPSAHPFANFVPVERLQRIITEIATNFDRVIGVHIRRTDNHQSLASSPTTAFIELMQAEISLDNNTKFFVATDSQLEEEQLKQTFPNRIITYQKQSLDRDDPVAIEDAVIDLYCLSKCRKLIGSYYSSFTDTAHQIEGIDYTIVKTSS
ncbi:hypothetical protein [Chamaesiphon sp.]|uniref:hypothetical protein n=1 Tax=Chamaesiphon sp. TaxID=2814140 RepID=UPI0035933FB9